MAHNFETGFVVRKPAWHGLADVLDDYPSDWTEARKMAGLEWEAVESPVYVEEEVTDDDSVIVPVDGFKAIRRDDTGDLLSIRADSYEVFPNADLGPLVEALLDEDDVRYETAGVLKGGRKVWVLVKLAEPFEVPGDPNGATLSRLAIQNSHDGSGALRAQRLQTRIVCDNTSHAADREAERHGYEFAFRHTANMSDNVEQAKAALDGLRSDREAYLEWATDLLSLDVDDRQQELFVTEFVPKPAADVVSDRVVSNIEKAREQIRGILASPTTAETAHTAYGLVQAGIEYLDHVRTFRSAESHFTRSYLRREKAKPKVERIAREAANA